MGMMNHIILGTTAPAESILSDSAGQSTGKAGKVQIIDATLKSLHGGFEIMYVQCPDSGEDQSDTCCDIRFCSHYRGRKEIVGEDGKRSLKIACDKEER